MARGEQRFLCHGGRVAKDRRVQSLARLLLAIVRQAQIDVLGQFVVVEQIDVSRVYVLDGQIKIFRPFQLVE
jgi:hypothetical protein